MEYTTSKSEEARRRAEEKFAKDKRRDEEVMTFQRQIQEAEAAKLLRLRALRLAKEAADREAARNSLDAGARARRARTARRTGRAKPSEGKPEP